MPVALFRACYSDALPESLVYGTLMDVGRGPAGDTSGFQSEDAGITQAPLVPREIPVADSSAEEKPSTTPPGTVEKVTEPPYPNAPEKAQIAVNGAEHLYREIRIDNALTTPEGELVRLAEGAPVEVKVEADPKDVRPIPESATAKE